MKPTTTCFLIALLLLATPMLAKQICVNAPVSTGGNGFTWSTAFNALPEAMKH